MSTEEPKKLNDIEQIMLFIDEYKVELLKIAVKDMDSREKNLYQLLREENLYDITNSKAKYIVEKLIPKLKEYYEEYHQKSANLIKIIDPHVKKILKNPAYQIILNKINPNDKKLFLKYITEKNSLDQEKLKYMITKVNPMLLSALNKLNPKEQKAVEVINIINEKGTEILSILSNKEYKIYKQIKEGEITLLTEEEIDILLNILKTRKFNKNEEYLKKIEEFNNKYKEKINEILYQLLPEESFTYNRIISQNINDIDSKQLEYMVNTIIPKIKDLINKKDKQDKQEEKKLNSQIQTFINKNIDDINEVLPLLSEDKKILISGYIDGNLDIYLKELKEIKENIIPELTSLIESYLNNPNLENKQSYIQKIIDFKIKYKYELSNIKFSNTKYQELLIKLKKDVIDNLSLSELKIICDIVLPHIEKWTNKEYNERQKLYKEIIEEYKIIRNEDYFIHVKRSLYEKDLTLLNKIDDKLNDITTNELQGIKRILKEIKIKIENLKERDTYIIKIKELINQNKDKKIYLEKIELETYERLQANPKVLIKEEVKRLYEALNKLLNPMLETSNDKAINKIIPIKSERTESKKSLIAIQEKTGYSKEITLKAISFMIEKDQELLKKKYGNNYDECIRTCNLTKIENNYINKRLISKIAYYSKLITENVPAEEIVEIEKQSHKRGRKNNSNEVIEEKTRKRKHINLINANSIYELPRFESFKKETVNAAIAKLNNQRLNELIDKRFNKGLLLEEDEKSYLTSTAFISLQRECRKIEQDIPIAKNKNDIKKTRKRKKLNELDKLKGLDEELIIEAAKILEGKEKDIFERYKKGEVLEREERNLLYSNILFAIKTQYHKINPTLKEYTNVSDKGINYVLERLSESVKEFYTINQDKLIRDFNEEELKYINNTLKPTISNILKNKQEKISLESNLIETFKTNGIDWETVKEGIKYLTEEEKNILIERYGPEYNSNTWFKDIKDSDKPNKMYYIAKIVKKLKKICILLLENNKEEIENITNNEKYLRPGVKRQDIYQIANNYPKIIIRLALESLTPEKREIIENINQDHVQTKKETNSKYAISKKIKKEADILLNIMAEKPELKIEFTDIDYTIVELLYNDINNAILDNLTNTQINHLYQMIKPNKEKRKNNRQVNKNRIQNNLYQRQEMLGYSKEITNEALKYINTRYKEILKKAYGEDFNQEKRILKEEENYILVNAQTSLKKISNRIINGEEIKKSKRKIIKSEETNNEQCQKIRVIINNTNLNNLIELIIKSNSLEERKELLSSKIFAIADQTIIDILKETKTKQEILIFLLVTNKIPNMEVSISEISNMFNITTDIIKEITYNCMNIIISSQENIINEYINNNILTLKKENE